METFDFNVNDYVYVKLTPLGEEIYFKHYEWMKDKFVIELPKSEIDGYCKFALWEFMRIFGEYLYNGCPNPFETTIKIEKEKLK